MSLSAVGSVAVEPGASLGLRDLESSVEGLAALLARPASLYRPKIADMGDESSLQAVGALSAAPTLTVRSRRRPSERAFAIFRRMVVERAQVADVMREFGGSKPLTRQRVYFLVRRVTKWSREHEGVGDVLALKVQSTMRLEALYRSVLKQWDKSCQDDKPHTITTVEGLATAYEGNVIRLPDKKTTTVKLVRHTGDPQLGRLLKEIDADIRGIWGADAPKQLTMPDASGAPIALAVLLNASSRTPALPHDPAEPTPNVIDVESELAKLDAADGPKA